MNNGIPFERTVVTGIRILTGFHVVAIESLVSRNNDRKVIPSVVDFGLVAKLGIYFVFVARTVLVGSFVGIFCETSEKET